MAAAVFMKAALLALSVDIYLHGPQAKDFRSHGALAVSLAALLVPSRAPSTEGGGYTFDGLPVELLIPELLWLIILILHAVENRESLAPAAAPAAAAAAPAAAAAAAPVESANAMPQVALKALEEAEKAFQKNTEEGAATNALGQPWNVDFESPDVKILYSQFPGQSCYWWRIESTLKGSVDIFMDQLFNWENRVKWDPSLAEGRLVKTYDSPDPKTKLVLSHYYTAAVGPISSRDFVQVGKLKTTDNGELHFINLSLDDKIKKSIPEAPKETSKAVRAFGFPGGGLKMIPVPGQENTFKCIIISAINLNGWLSASIVNSNMTKAFKDSTVQMKTICGRQLEMKKA